MVGKTLAHYEVVEQIGSGGMGDVYRARDTKLGRDVALKVLPADMARDPERRKRFEREARAIAALKHPNIVTIYSVEEADGVHFITMELVEGKSLSEILPKEGLGLARFFDIAVPLSDAMGSAHAKGITHRDLKPVNIMVDHDGRVKVLDFGLAKLLQSQLETDATVGGESDTQPGRVLGTVSYMSPEQAEGRTVDQRSDIFSLGIVMYEMATGERPFKGDSGISIMSSILRDTPPPVTELRRQLPNQLGRIIDHCLAKEPERRFQSALDVRNELENLKNEVTSTTSLHGRPAGSFTRERSFKNIRIGIVAVAFVALAVVFGPGLFKGDNGAVTTAEANSLAIFAFENLKDPEDPERLGQILQELLITDLSSVGDVKVFSSQRLYDIQKQMGGAEGHGSKEMASAVASRAGAETMLTGTLSQLGGKWILTCQVVDVDAGTIIKSKRIDGSDIYAMVDRLTGEFQSDFQIGEPAEVASKIPIKQKTSESLQAYRHYLAGADLLNHAQFGEAIGELEKAIEIDPNFGQAYYKLGVATWWEGDVPGDGKEQFEYLLENELYATEKEKRMAETMLQLVDYHFAEGLPLAEEVTRLYPDEKEAWYALGEALFHFPGGAHRSEARQAFEQAIALDPDFSLSYDHIFDAIWLAKQYDEGIAIADERIAKDPANPLWYRYRAGMIACKGDNAATGAAVALALEHSPTPADKRELYKDVARGAGILGRLELQEAYLDKALATDPTKDDPATMRQLIGLLEEQDKWDEAEQRIRAELAKNPDNTVMTLRLIQACSATNERAEAVALAKELVARHPDDAQGYRTWATEAVRLGDDREIATAIHGAVAKHTSTDDQRQLFGSVGFAYRDLGMVNTAQEYFIQAEAADPSNNFTFLDNALGQIEMERGNFDGARTRIERSLGNDPRNVWGLFLMAELLVRTGDRDGAAEYCRKAVDAIPVQWVAPTGRIVHGLLTKNLAEVDAAIQSVWDAEWSDAYKWNQMVDGHGSMAFALLAAGHDDRAAAIFTRALDLDRGKRSPWALTGLGWTLYRQGSYEKAAEAFTRGLGVGYNHESLLQGLAAVELAQGNNGKAEAYARRAIAENPPLVASRQMLGCVLAADDRYPEALEIAEATAALDSSRSSNELLAWVLIAGNIDVARGMQAARRAMAVPRAVFSFDDVPFAYRAPAEHSMGLGYLKQGDPDSAIEYLELAAELEPHRDLVQRDLARAREMASRNP